MQEWGRRFKSEQKRKKVLVLCVNEELRGMVMITGVRRLVVLTGLIER